MVPVSSMIVVASIGPMPGTDFNKLYSGRNVTRSASRFSSIPISLCSVCITEIGLHRERHIGRKTEPVNLPLIQTLNHFTRHP
jgi:hypothetical protein